METLAAASWYGSLISIPLSLILAAFCLRDREWLKAVGLIFSALLLALRLI